MSATQRCENKVEYGDGTPRQCHRAADDYYAIYALGTVAAKEHLCTTCADYLRLIGGIERVEKIEDTAGQGAGAGGGE